MASSNATCSSAEHDQIIEQYAHSLTVVCGTTLPGRTFARADGLDTDLYVLTPTVLGSLLLPFLCAIFYLSNPTQRRQPMFILVALAVVTGLAQSIMQATIHVRASPSPLMRDDV
jgi:hypothetical protein